MTSNISSAKDFFQLAINSLLELCTNCIDGHRIVAVEGQLVLSLDSGDKVALNILRQNLCSQATPTEDIADVSHEVCCLLLVSKGTNWIVTFTNS